MLVLEKGQYTGNVKQICGEAGIITSITAYDHESFNGSLHYHDNAHISFVLDGACVEKKHTSYDRTPGKITYYSAKEPHQVMRILYPSRHINLEIEPGFFEDYDVSDTAMHRAITRNPDAKFLMIKMYKELQQADVFSPVSIQLLLLKLVHQPGTLKSGSTPPVWATAVADYLHAHWNEALGLQELAHVAGIHPVNISKYFPVYFACTLGEYMRKLKVEKALSLIKSSPASLTDVAYECGFADQSHFIRNFKAFTGYLPAAYQRL